MFAQLRDIYLSVISFVSANITQSGIPHEEKTVIVVAANKTG
jgi:hypothetical protein